MDSDCDYLVYRKDDKICKEAEFEASSCPHCSQCFIQDTVIQCTSKQNAKNVSFDQALTGSMAPYVEVYQSTDESTCIENILLARSRLTTLRYVTDGCIVSLKGALHMQDVSPSGTWLSEKEECVKSVRRLRLAGLMCTHPPELNRIVLEQKKKNDDGLLYLTNRWLLNKKKT